MRIEKIELIGFKSFAEKTPFNFHPGITSIVGPNGCGKSNIVDAFRWVLGEQSAKSLRGEKMEEVIFSGSGSKKPKGMAEVTLSLSGIHKNEADGGGNGGNQSDTITVTRRLYRSGESEYMMNKNICRLKDIKDVFLDTGLEVKSYSILEQDRIAEILNAKPAERRFLIEEVAGVMKYNVRKKEAVSKLESARANLQRVNDIVIEVKKQISFLDRLARKAERYKKLTSEIHSIELKLFKREYQTLGSSLERILSEYGKLREEESLRKAYLSRIETDVEKRRLELVEKEKLLEDVQEKFQNLEREISGVEKHMAVASNEKENLREYLSRLGQQGEELELKGKTLVQRRGVLEEEWSRLVSDIEQQKTLLGEKAEHVRNLEEDLSAKDDMLERKRREVFRISEESSALRNEVAKLQSGLENLRHRESAALKDADNLKAMLSELESSLRDLESNLLEKKNGILMLAERRGILASEIAVLRQNSEVFRDSLSKLREDVASYISRIESLKELLFDASSKEVLKAANNFQLLESISDLIEVEDAYEKAIESALAEKINAFVVETSSDVESAISALRGKSAGRTALLCRNPVRPLPESSPGKLPSEVLGPASSFVRVREEFSDVIGALFDRFVVVKSISSALQLCSSLSDTCFVTLDGDVVEPSGAVITGEIKGVLRRKREMRELEAEIEDRREKIQRTQKELDSGHQLINSKEGEMKELEAALVAKEKDISLLKLTADNYREDKERRSRKLAYLSLEIDQITTEKASTEKILTEKEEEIGAVDSKRVQFEQDGQLAQEEMNQQRSRLEEFKSEVTDIRLSITSIKGKMEAAERERESINLEAIEIKEKKETIAAEALSVSSRIDQKEAEIAADGEKVRSLVVVGDGIRKELLERKEIIEQIQNELMDSQREMKDLRNLIETLSRQCSELDVQKAEHSLKMEAIFDNVRQHYGVSVGEVEVEPLQEDDEQRMLELREKIKELGTVNLGTLEEYEELRTRHDFLSGQQADLNRSISELEEAISKINVTTRKKLREAFEALKAKFSEVFIALFGGGRAELIMTDENNILDTGIDIIAQPPGKRLQNINLLSGGEKTLTALSLLFSSFLLKPTPLCILDEADSALDEMNTGKFANMIKEFSKETQFIVVTHNRNTMASADYIYGITMEEAGVSKVISMQLVEAI
jgi:chromosome segregation protein